MTQGGTTTRWQFVGDPLGPEVLKIEPDGKVWGVPKDEANADYSEYLAWLAKGNTPEPYDP